MSIDAIVGIAQNGMSQQLKRGELSARKISFAGIPIPSPSRGPGGIDGLGGGANNITGELASKVGIEDLKFRKVYSPDHSLADSDGYITYLDIDVAREFIEMNLAKRSYEANIRLFNNASEMISKALEIGK